MVNIIHKVWGMIDRIVYVVLKKIYHLLGKDLTNENHESFLQFIKFGIVGLSNTVISYTIYVTTLFIFKKLQVFPNTDYLLSSIIGFILSVLWSFNWNNKLVFKVNEGQKRSVWKALLKTYVSYSFTGLFFNNILLMFWVQICNISEFIAPIINLIVTVPLNFLLNKLWAFKQDENKG